MSRNEETSLASVKQGALQNIKGIWPVRARAPLKMHQEHPANLLLKNVGSTEESTDEPRKTQLYKQTNCRRSLRTIIIKKKLEARRLRRNLNENNESDKW